METYQYQVDGYPVQIVGTSDQDELQTIQVIHEQRVDDGTGVQQQVIQEELVLTLQDDMVQAVHPSELKDASATIMHMVPPPEMDGSATTTIMTTAEIHPGGETHMEMEPLTSNKKLSQKQFSSSSSYSKWQHTGPLNPDATQFIVNHYTIYRNENPEASHNKAMAETARYLGAAVRAVRAVLKDQLGRLPEMKPAKSATDAEDAEPRLYYTELTSPKACVRLIDEKVVMGLAKSFRCMIAIRETSADKKAHYHRIYKPANARRKMLTLANNGTTFKRVPNNEALLAKQDKELPCPVCQKTFKREQALTSHLRSHQSRFCKYCNKEFVTEGDRLASTQIVFHEQKCNPEEAARNKKAITCRACGKTFAHYPSLKRHKQICRPKCEECDLSFKSTESFNSHKCPFEGSSVPKAERLKLRLALQKAVKNNDSPLSKSVLSKKASYQDKINALKQNMLSPI